MSAGPVAAGFGTAGSSARASPALGSVGARSTRRERGRRRYEGDRRGERPRGRPRGARRWAVMFVPMPAESSPLGRSSSWTMELRREDRPAARGLGIGLLARGMAGPGEGVLPAEIVPVVDMGAPRAIASSSRARSAKTCRRGGGTTSSPGWCRARWTTGPDCCAAATAGTRLAARAGLRDGAFELRGLGCVRPRRFEAGNQSSLRERSGSGFGEQRLGGPRR